MSTLTTPAPTYNGDKLLAVTIAMTPYHVVEIDGVATTLYGEAQSASYNAIAQ